MKHKTEPVAVSRSTTIAEWRDKIAGLQAELHMAETSLEEQTAVRKKAAGELLLGIGSTPEDVHLLERLELDLQHRVDALRAGIELGEAEIRRLEDEQRRAVAEEKRKRRQALGAEIREHAAAVDLAFDQAGRHVEAIAELLVHYQLAGGAFSRSMRGVVTRAMQASRLRPFFEVAYYVGPTHIRPLAEQLAPLAFAPGTEAE